MYAELLGMRPVYIGYHKLVHADGQLPAIGFEHSPEDAPPVWGDPQRPAQVHVDLVVDDVDDAARLAVRRGAVPLFADEGHHVLADPVGHPFCLRSGDGPPRIDRVVFDSRDPERAADYYARLLGFDRRATSDQGDVELRDDRHPVALAFRRSGGPRPTWPDPTHPAQLHLDLVLDDPEVDSLLARIERLGGAHLALPSRPDNLVCADPDGHPSCVGEI